MATYDTSKSFKTGNGFLTKILFWENWVNLPFEKRIVDPVFTLHEPRNGLVSFRERYVALGDPTGYKLTQELLFGNYRHWQELMKAKWFLDAKKEWDEELDAKLKAEGLDKIRETAKSDDKQALVAAKYLANKEYRDKTGPRRGRPSKEEVQGELKRMSEEEKAIAEDAARLKIVK